MATTPNSTPTDLEFIGHIISDKLDEQPTGKKIANTITAIVGAIVSIAAVALTLPITLPDWAYLIIVTVTTLGTALGVKQTQNGFSESQRRKLQQWQAEYIDARHTHDDTVAPSPDTPESDGEYVGRRRAPENLARELTDAVDQFIAARRGRS